MKKEASELQKSKGLFRRILDFLDKKMEQKSKQSCCCKDKTKSGGSSCC
ncbi:hypothetical protein KDK77_00790 [bacterium]|nr:hypothetical protein [bacterium]